MTANALRPFAVTNGIDPFVTAAYARIHLCRGRYAEAFDSIVAYHAVQPDGYAEFFVAGLLRKQGLFEAALRWLDRSAAHAQRVPAALAQKARVLSQLGRHEEALEVARRAVALRPAAVDTNGALGYCLRRSGHPIAAFRVAKGLLARSRTIGRDASELRKRTG